MGRKIRRRGGARPLTNDQFWELALCGPDDRGKSSFPSEEASREAWFAHRDEWMGEGHGCPGRRPFGWWRFEAKEGQPHGVDELERLNEMGELTPDERALLYSWYCQRVSLDFMRYQPASIEPARREAAALGGPALAWWKTLEGQIEGQRERE